MHSVPFETVRKKISFWPLQPPLRCKFAVLHLLAQWFPAWNIIHSIIITRIKTEQDYVVVCACTAWFVHIIMIIIIERFGVMFTAIGKCHIQVENFSKIEQVQLKTVQNKNLTIDKLTWRYYFWGRSNEQ